jgi:uncharacterized protein DUF5995
VPADRIRTVGRDLRNLATGHADALGYFPAIYARETYEVGGGAANLGPTVRGQLDELVETFAHRYTGAWRNEIPRASCWEASWVVGTRDDLLIVQHILLGINAHINFDLPQAVVQVGKAGGSLERLRETFDSVEESFGRTYASSVKDLDRVSRWTSEADLAGGRHLFNFSLRRARQQAWTAAENLYPLGQDAYDEYVQELDRLVSVLAYLITKPPLPVAVLAWFARRFEDSDCRRVTSTLLGDIK